MNFFIIQFSLNRYNRKALSGFTPAMIVVPEDGLGGNLDLILLARNKGIPVIDIPYEYSTKKQIVEAIKSNPDYQKLFGIHNPFNRLVGFLFPRWVYTYLGETLLRERPSIILSLETFCLAPRDPWTVHGGFADYIAVESRKMYKHYLNEGIPQNKLILTGTMADDHLFETMIKKEMLRNDLCKSHGLKSGDKLVVSSLPTDYTIRSGCEFENYKAMIDFWIGNLNRLKDTAVIIQLHPAVTPEQEEYIRSKKLVISESNIANLIPLCDVFVTSVSSVIRMAITCKVPVVNYDVFKFGYKDYEDATGVITLSSKEDFESILVELMSNKEVYDSIIARHSHYAAEWGFLDGKSGERILKLFLETISGKTRRTEK